MIHEIYIGDSLNISTDRQMYTILLYSRKEPSFHNRRMALFLIDKSLYISCTPLPNIVRNVTGEFHALLVLHYHNYAVMDHIRYVYDCAHNLDLEVESLIIVISYMDELIRI